MFFRIAAKALVSFTMGVALAVLAAEPPEVPPTPGQVIIACAADLYATREVELPDGKKGFVPQYPGTEASTIRYIWLDVDAKDRANEKKVMDGHLNLLSRRAGIKTAKQVTPWLYMIDLQNYGEEFAKSWEKSGTGNDWVFHEEDFTDEIEYEEVEQKLGFYYDASGNAYREPGPGRTFRVTETKKIKKPVAKKAKGFAKWVTDTPEAKTAFENLQTKMGKTDVPVLQWTHLYYESAVSLDRKVGYYGFLGIKDLKTYERLIGVARKEVDAERLAEIREAVANSTVTTPETLRRIVVLNAVGGHYFLTQDSNQKKLAAGDVDKGNPLFEHGDDYVFQAIETFGNLNNGLPATGLFSNAGEKQDIAPDFIASDSTAPYTDRKVHVNLSCVRCHSNGGMQDVNGWVRNVLNLPPNQLNGRTPEEKKKLAEFYVERHLEPAIKAYRERVDTACLEATGWKWQQFSAAYAKSWARVEGPVTIEMAALELGCTVAAYKTALLKLGPSCHPSLVAHRLEKPVAIPRALWIRAYPFAQDALRGVIRPFKVEVKDK